VEGMAKAAKLRAKRPIIAGDQGSCWGHQYSKTSLTGEPSSIVSVDESLGREPLPLRREANG
jgi:hypothetical protein